MDYNSNNKNNLTLRDGQNIPLCQFPKKILARSMFSKQFRYSQKGYLKLRNMYTDFSS